MINTVPESNIVEELLQELRSGLDRLDILVEKSQIDGDGNKFGNRLDRWKERTASYLEKRIGPKDAENFRSELGVIYMGMGSFQAALEEAKAAKNFLEALFEDVEEHPESFIPVVPSPSVKNDGRTNNDVKPESNEVFIVHGHDELNLRRLKDIVKEEFGLDPIVMMAKPGAGRTLIEKFEQEGSNAAYALVLMTPDDMIAVENSELYQSRPNVLFEMGWFYGRLGRSRVCIVFKKGTKIPSDLKGIERIEFNDSPEEKVAALRKELEKAGMI